MKKQILTTLLGAVLLIAAAPKADAAYEIIITAPIESHAKGGVNSELVKSYCQQIPENDYPTTRKECFVLSNGNFNGQALSIAVSYANFTAAPMFFTDILAKIRNKRFDGTAIADIDRLLTFYNSSMDRKLKALYGIANKRYTAEEKEACSGNVACWVDSGSNIDEEPGY